MNRNERQITITFIWLEAIFGILGGIVYIAIAPENKTDSMETSILKFFLFMNVIFFCVTIVFGAINLILIKRTKQLLVAFLLSLGFGILCILICVLASSVIEILAAFIPLAGYIFGFNFRILKLQDRESY